MGCSVVYKTDVHGPSNSPKMPPQTLEKQSNTSPQRSHHSRHRRLSVWYSRSSQAFFPPPWLHSACSVEHLCRGVISERARGPWKVERAKRVDTEHCHHMQTNPNGDDYWPTTGCWSRCESLLIIMQIGSMILTRVICWQLDRDDGNEVYMFQILRDLANENLKTVCLSNFEFFLQPDAERQYCELLGELVKFALGTFPRLLRRSMKVGVIIGILSVAQTTWKYDSIWMIWFPRSQTKRKGKRYERCSSRSTECTRLRYDVVRLIDGNEGYWRDRTRTRCWDSREINWVRDKGYN